jgi:hypothetical protein
MKPFLSKNDGTVFTNKAQLENDDLRKNAERLYQIREREKRLREQMERERRMREALRTFGKKW